jgi:hypothetical protein
MNKMDYIKEYKIKGLHIIKYINIEDYKYCKINNIYYFSKELDLYFSESECLSQSNINGEYNCCEPYDNRKIKIIIPSTNQKYQYTEYSICPGSMDTVYTEKNDKKEVEQLLKTINSLLDKYNIE